EVLEPDTVRGLAIEFELRGDPAAAARIWRRAAERGDPSAMCQLGFLYDRGEGVPKDAAEALRWYRAAAEKGNPTAMFNLSLIYHQGRGVPKDDAAGDAWSLAEQKRRQELPQEHWIQ